MPSFLQACAIQRQSGFLRETEKKRLVCAFEHLFRDNKRSFPDEKAHISASFVLTGFMTSCIIIKNISCYMKRAGKDLRVAEGVTLSGGGVAAGTVRG